MKRSLAFFALLVLAGALAFAQTRDSIRVYVQSVAADPAHAVYFRESFAEEVEAAGYSLAYRASAADFVLGLAVMPNLVLYDDGAWEQAPPNEKQFILQINLTRMQDNTEMVAFSFPFTYMGEMDAYNQYLFYQVMSNLPFSVPDNNPRSPVEVVREVPVEVVREVLVPTEVEVLVIREVPVPTEVVREVQVPVEVIREVEVVREVQVPVEVIREVPVPVEVEVFRNVPVPVEVEVFRDVPVPVPVQVPVEVLREVPVQVLVQESESWRNKLLYVRTSADVPVSYFQVRPGQNPGFVDRIIMIPGATIGLEVQFLNWMSAELGITARFADVVDYTFNPGLALQFKFPLKPSSYFMLEPYLAAGFSLNNALKSDTPYYLDAGGGFQLGVKGGQAGAWFLDLSYMHNLNNFVYNFIPAINEVSSNGPLIYWSRFVVGVSVGYKFGLVDRGR